MNARETLLADEVRRLIEIHKPAEIDLVGIGVERDVGSVGEQAAFHAADRRGPGGADIELPSGLHDALPERVAVAAVAKEDLIAALAAPAGAGHDYGNAIELRLYEAKQREPRHPVAEHGLHGLGGARALHL